jgi:hypothetical protein
MTDYYIPLTFNFYPLNKPITEYGTIPYQSIDSKDINLKLYDFFKQYNLVLSGFGLFYKPAPNFTKPHTDCEGGDYVKINYIYGGKDSKMIWYKTKDNIPIKESNTGKPGLYIPYNFNEVEKIYEQTLSEYNIVQVGIPHTILNMIETRWCLTIVISHQSDRSRVTMRDIKNILNLK